MSVDPSMNANPLQNQTPANAPANAQAATNTTAAANHKVNAEFTSQSTVGGTMAGLKEKFPQFYKQSLLGIAQTMCSKMREDQEKIKKAWRGQS